MKLEIPTECQAAAELTKTKCNKRPIPAGELKALWLNWPIVNKVDYAEKLHRSYNMYKRLHIRLEAMNEKRELTDDDFIAMAKEGA